MIAIRSNRRAAIACLLALTFAGALANHASAVSPAEVLLQGEASPKNVRRPASDENRRLRDERAAMVRTQIASRGVRNDAIASRRRRLLHDAGLGIPVDLDRRAPTRNPVHRHTRARGVHCVRDLSHRLRRRQRDAARSEDASCGVAYYMFAVIAMGFVIATSSQ